MARQHGITSNTYKRFIIDSGAVYKNYDESGEALLGATRGGNTFTMEQEIRDMPVDGAKGRVKGHNRITRVNAIIVANFLEVSADILNLAFPGSSVADFGSPKTHDQVTRSLAIALSDYVTNIAIIGEVTGGAANANGIIIDNALVTENIEVGHVDNDESVLSLTFTAHFDPADLDTEPWRFRFPVIA